MATAPATRTTLTLDEFFAMPSPADGSVDYLLDDGEVVAVTKPSFEHNELLGDLYADVRGHVRRHQLGRVSLDILVILDPSRAKTWAPDLVFVAAANLQRIRNGRVFGPPDLVVEILSPSTRADDLGRKLADYHRYEVPWYWTLDPDGPTLVERRREPGGYVVAQTVGGGIFRPALFPGLEIDLGALGRG